MPKSTKSTKSTRAAQGSATPKPKGGRRPGAGRPRTKAVRALLSNVLIAELETLGPDLLPAVRELVRGVHIAQTNKQGEQIIYRQPPNPQMIVYVIDRLIGKVPTRTEVTGGEDEDGNALPVPLLIHLAQDAAQPQP